MLDRVVIDRVALDRDAVDELGRAHAVLGCADVADAAARWAQPITVGISGRPGVGKTALMDALLARPDFHSAELVTEIHGVDSPEHRDPPLDCDVLVHVIVDLPHPSDLTALAHRAAPDTLVVLGKADTLPGTRRVAEALSAALDQTDIPAVPMGSADDRAGPVRAAVTDLVHRARLRHDRRLLVALEATAARDPALRTSIETFLRAAVGTLGAGR